MNAIAALVIVGIVVCLGLVLMLTGAALKSTFFDR